MIVIVAGMHRSGTSAMSGFLHKNGIMMGRESDFHPRPKKENPKGFYENKLFRTLNDQWLRKYSTDPNYLVKQWAKEPPRLLGKQLDNQDREKARELIDFYNQYWKNSGGKKGFGYWGWKDPRNCLTLSLWFQALKGHQVRVVIMEREPESIGKSLKARRNCSIQRGIDLSRIYMELLKEQLALCDYIPRIYIDFDEFIENTPKTCEKLSKFIGKEINMASSGDFLDKDLRHWENGK